ncbi:phosphatase 2C-like domain-containing protein [Amylocarpus encephaloides]|uniref:Protein phosphatase n=1 Tax=Amylocarpus encephaloides TaxID=45428 RepID=A0A9P7YRE1_9HELO|nr:phosphatase 2C-like domain-containing protein [Amylocarpus encephaloides]
MRRSFVRSPLARAISPRARRSFQGPSTCHPELVAASPSADANPTLPQKDSSPFRFETGISLYAKRPPRPFPPPFLSRPSGSFSDPLSTHHQSRDRRPQVNGELIRGYTNGDDAVYASDNFIAANDGVGAWSTRPGGHAGLWSRLILHFWALEMDLDRNRSLSSEQQFKPNPIEYLQKAYEETITATSKPNQWQGTTTAAGAQLHYRHLDNDPKAPAAPLLYVTNLGDSQVLILRPRNSELVFKTTEQWHWFDCPRQLGTNSPDTPRDNAVMDLIEIEENDVVLAMSDGVIDNLWEHEIIEGVVDSIRKWEAGQGGVSTGDRRGGAGGGMTFVAKELMNAAKAIATDPFAESPFMEHAVEEGLAMEGGKHDDISVVAALCRRSSG